MKRQPKQVFLSMFARTAEQAPAYIFLAFIFTYNNQVMKMSRDFVLTSLICAGLLSFISIPLAGALSDRFGRKRVYIIGSLLTGIYGFVYFGLLNTMVPALIVLGIIVSFIPHDIMYGPQAALDLRTVHAARLRYEWNLDRLSASLRRPPVARRRSSRRRCSRLTVPAWPSPPTSPSPQSSASSRRR